MKLIASKRKRIVNNKNAYSQRGNREMKINKWNKKLREVMK
jgi:hypothetical protein